MLPDKMNPIVAITSFDFVDPDGEQTIAAILQAHQEYGIRRFLLQAPFISMLLAGYRGPETYRRIGEKLRRIQERVSGRGIQVGWWCQPTLETGKSPFQKVTGLDGKISDHDFIAACPLDRAYQEEFARNVALVASIAHPFLIKMEDDFKISGHGPVQFGCFCPLHLKEFARRTGVEYSRQDLEKIFSTVTPESRRLRVQWAELSRDSLAAFAKVVREKLDEVSPETRISLCQSGISGFDGEFTEAVESAFAGKTKPMVRVFGIEYYNDDAVSMPSTLFNVLYSKQHLPKNFELVYEADPCPSTRFFASASYIKSMLGGALSYGLTDGFVLTAQYLDHPFEDPGYNAMLRDESARFAALREAVSDCTPAGCEICNSPWTHTVVPYNPSTGSIPFAGGNGWVGLLGAYGIPYTVAPSKVKMLGGKDIASYLSDEEIRTLLSGGVMIDGPAAEILTRRGFGDLIGVDAGPGDTRKIEFCFERIEKDAGFENVEGELMANLMFALAYYEGSGFRTLRPRPQAKVLSSLIDADGKPVMPGMVRFENSLGGRVVVVTYDMAANSRSSALYNYRKKEMTRQMLEWLGREKLPVYVKKQPRVFCILNLPENREKAVITLINLCSDAWPEAELATSPEWIGSAVASLNPAGQWIPSGVVAADGTVKVPVKLEHLNPVYLKLNKPCRR